MIKYANGTKEIIKTPPVKAYANKNGLIEKKGTTCYMDGVRLKMQILLSF
ncbi:MAG: hypothetical protein H7296_14315 [Bacteroidia bacterium]|nr:hypothetical protein [Bacteroidia bacterium]